MKKRGRPKFRHYDKGITIRMTTSLYNNLRLEFDRWCVIKGQWDIRGNRRSFNEFLVCKLTGEC